MWLDVLYDHTSTESTLIRPFTEETLYYTVKMFCLAASSVFCGAGSFVFGLNIMVISLPVQVLSRMNSLGSHSLNKHCRHSLTAAGEWSVTSAVTANLPVQVLSRINSLGSHSLNKHCRHSLTAAGEWSVTSAVTANLPVQVLSRINSLGSHSLNKHCRHSLTAAGEWSVTSAVAAKENI